MASLERKFRSQAITTMIGACYFARDLIMLSRAALNEMSTSRVLPMYA